MRSKRVILTVAALVLAAYGAAWLVLRPGARVPEPVYQGKKLSVWLEIYEPGNTNRSSEQLKAAQTAIREMGTNCVPTLLHKLEQKDSRVKLTLVSMAKWQSFVKVRHVPDFNRYESAGMAIQVLGPRAESAIPELIRIYDLNLSPASQQIIARVLGTFGPKAKAAVPSLLRGAASTDAFVKINAVSALARIHSDPERVVPVLISALQTKDPSLTHAAVNGLMSFGPDAKAAAPALVKFIESLPPTPQNNPYSGLTMREIAVHALGQIDPEAARKAGY